MIDIHILCLLSILCCHHSAKLPVASSDPTSPFSLKNSVYTVDQSTYTRIFFSINILGLLYLWVSHRWIQSVLKTLVVLTTESQPHSKTSPWIAVTPHRHCLPMRHSHMALQDISAIKQTPLAFQGKSPCFH